MLPDLEVKASEYDHIASELETKEVRIQELESLLTRGKKGWFNSIASWFKGQP